MDIVEVFFEEIDEQISELIIAELSVAGYETFWQDDDGLRAYVRHGKLNREELGELCQKYSSDKTVVFKVQETNPGKWDRVKEEFEPFVIADSITVRSGQPIETALTPYEIILDAQMAFGTGKHPSTALCLQAMLDLDFTNKNVLDLGTGSGVLAVMAEKLGAESIVAVDNNPWAINVANQVINDNNCSKISLAVEDIDGSVARCVSYPIVLANLNIDVLSTEFVKFVDLVDKDGCLLVSGFMEKDSRTIEEIIERINLHEIQRFVKSNWLAILLKRS